MNLFIHLLHIYLFIYLSIYLSVSLYIYHFILLVCQSIDISVLFINLYICLSFYVTEINLYNTRQLPLRSLRSPPPPIPTPTRNHYPQPPSHPPTTIPTLTRHLYPLPPQEKKKYTSPLSHMNDTSRMAS